MRLAFRTLLRSPWFAATSIGTIALTIALSATVFAVVDGVLFKPLPYPSPERLFELSGTTGGGFGSASLALLDVEYLRAADPRIAITALGGGSSFTHPDQPDVRLSSLAVDRHFFDVLGQRPLVGGFRPEDYVGAEGTNPAIVTDGFWRQWLGSDPAAIGRSVPIVGGTLLIVGVLPPDFVIPVRNASGKPSVLVPLVVPPAAAGDRWARSLTAIARLGNEVGVEQAQALLDRALATRVGEYPARKLRPGPYTAVMMRPLEAVLGARERPLFGVAFAGAVLLVMLGAINVTGLVGARARDRHSEISIRAALGAQRRDLAALVLTEAMLIAIFGAAVGLVLSEPLLRAATASLPESLTLLKTPSIDWRVVAFAALAAVLPVVFFALAPASSAARGGLALRLSEKSSTARVRSSGRFLLGAESAISIVLVLTGALVLSGFLVLRSEDSGLDEDGLAVVELAFTERVAPSVRAERESLALERLRRMPGVRDVATIGVPLFDRLYVGSRFAPPAGAIRAMASDVPVSSAFFDVAGLRVLDGRVLTREEIEAARPFVVISDDIARRYWPQARAVGQELESSTRISLATGAPEPGKTTVTVVGVVERARLASQKDQEGQGQIYLPASMGRRGRTVYLLRGTDPQQIARAASLVIRSDVAGVIATRAEPLETALANTVREERLQAMVFGLAGGAGLLLVAVGVGGLAALSVARRVREIGIRAALGARRCQLVGMIVLEHARASLAGVVVGLISSWWATRLVRAYVYQRDVHNPTIWVAATVTLLGVVLLGAWLPARGASRVDPTTALRAE